MFEPLRCLTSIRRITPVLGGSLALTTACLNPVDDIDEPERVAQHLERVLDVMQEHSVHRNTIDWTGFRAAVHAAAPNPKNIEGIFGAIEVALGLLGDNHSSYRWQDVTLRNSLITCAAPFAPQPGVPPDIGYVRVPAVTDDNPNAMGAYARDLQQAIEDVDSTSVGGWIVDLRGNLGGNMWPMIAGLGPILGERTLGFLLDADGNEKAWDYAGGASRLGGATKVSIFVPYSLLTPDPRVAVLIDGAVANSAEAVAVAFKGRPNTRFFGTPTCGLSTYNEPFAVGVATLSLTTMILADRTRLAYGDTLRPDETIANEADLVTRAIAWLRGGQ